MKVWGGGRERRNNSNRTAKYPCRFRHRINVLIFGFLLSLLFVVLHYPQLGLLHRFGNMIIADQMHHGGPQQNVGYPVLEEAKSVVSAIAEQSVEKLPHLDRPRKLLYVHVGKTGGTTLDKVLRSNCNMYHIAYGRKQEAQRCHNALIDGGTSHLSNRTLYTLHTRGERQMRKVLQNITSVLWTVRNPIARIVSAFNMMHPQNAAVRGIAPGSSKLRREYRTRIRSEFYEECFPTVEDLAMVLSRKNGTKMIHSISHIDVQDYRVETQTQEKPLDCYALGLATVQGRGLELTNDHLFYNIPRYANLILDRYEHMKEILVIRTEHLWNDTFTLNGLLADEADAASTAAVDVQHESSMRGMPSADRLHAESWGSERYPVRFGLSREGKAVICCFVKHEMKLFAIIVRRAVNLSENEKEAYLAGIFKDCAGFSGDEDSLCGGAIDQNRVPAGG